MCVVTYFGLMTYNFPCLSKCVVRILVPKAGDERGWRTNFPKQSSLQAAWRRRKKEPAWGCGREPLTSCQWPTPVLKNLWRNPPTRAPLLFWKIPQMRQMTQIYSRNEFPLDSTRFHYPLHSLQGWNPYTPPPKLQPQIDVKCRLQPVHLSSSLHSIHSSPFDAQQKVKFHVSPSQFWIASRRQGNVTISSNRAFTCISITYHFGPGPIY